MYILSFYAGYVKVESNPEKFKSPKPLIILQLYIPVALCFLWVYNEE